MLDRLANERWMLEFGRFVMVGVVTFLINLSAVYLFLKVLHLHYGPAVSLAYFITVLCHFTANKSFTFQAWRQPFGRNALRYALMLSLNYCITLAISWVIIGRWHLPGYVAVICYTAANATTSFLIMKHVVFRPGRATSVERLP